MGRTTRTRDERRQRIRRWLVLAPIVLIVALVGVLLLALGTRAGRGWVTARAASWVEARYGVAASVEDFSLQPLRGEFVARGISAGVPGQPPVVQVAELRAEWSPSSLFSGRPLIHRLEVERPVVDLTRPLPQFEAAGADEPGATKPIALQIDEIRVAGGRLHGIAPEALSRHLESWTVQPLSVHGSFHDGEYVAEVQADGRVKAVGREPDALQLAASVRGGIGAATQVEELLLTGESLRVAGQASVGPGPEQVVAELEAQLNPSYWLGLGDGAPLRANGRVDLGEWRGAVEVRAADQPGGLLRPWLDAESFAQLELAGSRFDLEARFELERPAVRAVAGEAELVVHRAATTAVVVHLQPTLELDGQRPLDVPFELALLPESAGRRRAAGTVRGLVSEPSAWRLDGGEVETDLPDLRGFVAQLATLWPDLAEWRRLTDLPELGSLQTKLSADGPLSDPALEAQLRWQPTHGGAGPRGRRRSAVGRGVCDRQPGRGRRSGSASPRARRDGRLATSGGGPA